MMAARKHQFEAERAVLRGKVAELEAQIGGTVREVHVQPGELVTGGATLVTIGPA